MPVNTCNGDHTQFNKWSISFPVGLSHYENTNDWYATHWGMGFNSIDSWKLCYKILITTRRPHNPIDQNMITFLTECRWMQTINSFPCWPIESDLNWVWIHWRGSFGYSMKFRFNGFDWMVHRSDNKEVCMAIGHHKIKNAFTTSALSCLYVHRATQADLGYIENCIDLLRAHWH